jgi:large subunit ribosomal protein L9
MEVILLEKVRNLGALGEKVKVKPGYGRNYLIPQGIAIYATDHNIAEFEKKRATLEKRALEVLEEAQRRAEKLKELKISIPSKASEEGKLFGSIGTREIADAINAAGIEIEKREVSLPHGVIRYIGEYDVDLLLHSDLTVPIKVNIVVEE